MLSLISSLHVDSLGSPAVAALGPSESGQDWGLVQRRFVHCVVAGLAAIELLDESNEVQLPAM